MTNDFSAESRAKHHESEDSAVNVTFRAWARTQDYFNLRWKYTAEIKKRFAEENITIPFPQRVVHWANTPQI